MKFRSFLFPAFLVLLLVWIYVFSNTVSDSFLCALPGSFAIWFLACMHNSEKKTKK